MLAYLKNGRLGLSNNRAERNINPFVIDRKNFLFANTPGGAQGSVVIFSLIEMAKEYRLDPVSLSAPCVEDGPDIGLDEGGLVISVVASQCSRCLPRSLTYKLRMSDWYIFQPDILFIRSYV